MRRYPLPNVVLADNGKQFTSIRFKKKLSKIGIKVIHSTPYNPTGNSVCERIHRSLGNKIRICIRKNLKEAVNKTADMLRATIHDRLGTSPMNFLFNRNKIEVIDPIKSISHEEVKRKAIERSESKSKQANEALNKNRKSTQYNKGDSVLVLNMNRKSKYDEIYNGPYSVLRISKSGNFLYLDVKGKEVKVNIKRVIPFKKEVDVMEC